MKYIEIDQNKQLQLVKQWIYKSTKKKTNAGGDSPKGRVNQN